MQSVLQNGGSIRKGVDSLSISSFLQHVFVFYSLYLPSYISLLSATIPTCVVNPSDNGIYEIKEFNEFEVQCNAEYAGNWSPTILCELPAKQSRATTSNIMSSNVSFSQQITALRNMSNTSVNCATTFTKDGLHFVNITRHRGVESVQKHANNVPSYSFTWSSPCVTVLC